MKQHKANLPVSSDISVGYCYCGLWQTNPEILREQGIPEGFCGICQQCQNPGHTRHFPGGVPYTGAWCDSCYRELAEAGPFRSLSTWFMLLVSVIAVFSIYHFISQMFK